MPISERVALAQAHGEAICEPMSAEHVARYNAVADDILAGPGVYRKGFRARRGG